MADWKIASSEDVHEIDTNGAFKRQQNRFTTPFGDGSEDLPVEPNRYRLLWAAICPWAHRQIIVLHLLGLQDVISIGKVSPIRTEKGWEFSLDEDGLDPVLKIRYLPEIYAETDPFYNGRATVPTIVDVKNRKVVNNDYHHLSNYWETAWKPYQKQNAPDLYPTDLQKDIDALNDIIFNEVNNGVYKAGFAHSQQSYEEAYDILFNRLDWLEKRLQNQRFLFGDYITDADIRLYVTLARFDVAYYSVFRVNRNRLIDFTNLWNYAKDLYQTVYFGETTDFHAIKQGYQLGDIATNPYQLLAKGPDTSCWHDSVIGRKEISNDPQNKFLLQG